jgi:hypothetical protein
VNLGQMMMVLGAMALLSLVVLSANSGLLENTDTTNDSEYGVTQVSLATSLIEEAMSKSFDNNVATTGFAPITSPSGFSNNLGRDGNERYRGTSLFNDFDDYNRLFIVYKNSSDATSTPSSDYEYAIPGLRSKYYVRVSVGYVDYPNLDVVVNNQTYHKKMTVTVIRQDTQPTAKDTLTLSAIMSYW